MGNGARLLCRLRCTGLPYLVLGACSSTISRQFGRSSHGAGGAPPGAGSTRDVSVPPRIWSATLLQALGRQWSALCTLLTLALLARALAPAEFGRFTFYLAVFSF